MQARDTKDWHKVNTIAGAGDLTRVYYWIVSHCKGKFQVRSDYIKFEKSEDATFFGIGYR